MSTTFSARLNRLFETVYPPGRGPQANLGTVFLRILRVSLGTFPVTVAT
jgi:hypothetical protein